MNRLLTLLLALLLSVMPRAAGQAGLSPVYSYWTVFLHEGSGYELPVPPGMRALGDPQAEDQPIFVSRDGSFRMTAWGGLSRQSPRPHFEAEWKLALNKPGRSINYRRKANTWFVVSGTDHSGIEFYEKFIMRGNHVGGFALTYPRSRLREFDPWVVAIEKDFRLVGTPGLRQESAPSRETPPEISARSVPRKSPTRGDDPPATARSRPESDRSIPETFAGSGNPNPQSDREIGPALQSAPTGEKVPGKPGFVHSPFDSERRLVDVEGIPAGTAVRCPYTKRIFRVP